MDAISDASEDAYETVQVGKKQYRRLKPEYVTAKAPTSNSRHFRPAKDQPFEAPGEPLAAPSNCDEDEPDTCKVDLGKPEETGEYQIKQTPTGFTCDLNVDPKFYNSIIGPKGATVTKLRQTTGCNINVPKKDSPSTSIHFAGATREAVVEAIKGVMYIIQSADLSAANARPKRMEFDFFVSVPLLDEGFAIRLESFYGEVKSLINSRATNLDAKSLMRPCTLHFTLAMLHLHTPAKIIAAQELLRSLAPQVLELTQNKSLTVDWGHLQTFQTSLEKASIVYMEPGPETTKVLRPVADFIRKAFIDAGFVGDEKEEQRPLVLHATLINSKNAFDATKIFALKSAAFPPFTVNEIHLSQRFNYDDNGYYHCVEMIPFK